MIELVQLLGTHLNVSEPRLAETVQSLWSGYGAIERWHTDDGTVIVKRISPPNEVNHPRGWHSDLSHRRKLRSYQVEQYWYEQYLPRYQMSVRLPKLLCAHSTGEQQLMVFEDLLAGGFDCAITAPTESQLRACVKWLAGFHGQFLGEAPIGLWPQGSYWHLDTRPEEWAVMGNLDLQAAAHSIDSHIQKTQYKTIIHGDAKLANFCANGNEIAGLDFQYVGGGSGVRDLAYFLGSCLNDAALLQQQPILIDYYFEQLALILHLRGIDPAPVEAEWRSLYDFEVADFARFLDGWAPGHWKINSALNGSVERVLAWHKQHFSNVVPIAPRGENE